MPDKYGVGGDAQYCHPDSDVLINKLGIIDEAGLQAAEIELTQARIEQFEPDFDNISLAALCGIHRFLFQDLYEWAGDLRTVDISKGNTRFANVSRIEPEANSTEWLNANIAAYHCQLAPLMALLDRALTPI